VAPNLPSDVAIKSLLEDNAALHHIFVRMNSLERQTLIVAANRDPYFSLNESSCRILLQLHRERTCPARWLNADPVHRTQRLRVIADSSRADISVEALIAGFNSPEGFVR